MLTHAHYIPKDKCLIMRLCSGEKTVKSPRHHDQQSCRHRRHTRLVCRPSFECQSASLSEWRKRGEARRTKIHWGGVVKKVNTAINYRKALLWFWLLRTCSTGLSSLKSKDVFIISTPIDHIIVKHLLYYDVNFIECFVIRVAGFLVCATNIFFFFFLPRHNGSAMIRLQVAAN